MIRLAVLVSGGGTNMQAILDSTKSGILKNIAEVVLVISNNVNAYALQRAKNENIKSICIQNKAFTNLKDFNNAILQELLKEKIDLVCLAGYMMLIGEDIISEYSGKILNIHPSILPKFSGKGMYGHHVHKAVIESKEKKSGATVHFVEAEYDTGRIILQKEVDVFDKELPEELAKRVLNIEHQIYPQAIKKVIESKFKLGLDRPN
ncbi:MAG: phosphoribosylglycinamide formyltransferase [Endomicrobium sp.]|jgi:phosphoribosylglycinamide formyltransferase-1|uniref:phosphoribosylglycinamide formyltransferase n=1 Tax=Candidatus Endomicrobiellum cubanum TaxID=3242325 RepID=UPI0028391F96|nr:phosphoribosylglycinamide formyltransferase [Endomicrobium sp.]MDR2395017.1 phosphoribosylglycinamide formyltransferase [Endomicrobium sp.]